MDIRWEPWDGAYPVSEDTIEDWAKEVVNYLRTHPKENYWHVASGDSIVIGRRIGSGRCESISVDVCKVVKIGFATRHPDGSQEG